LEAANGHFGGDGRGVFDAGTETFKTPHLRNMYQKVGMFGEPEPPDISNPLVGSVKVFRGPFSHTGPQIRGFGYSHDGGFDTLNRFVSAGVFTFSNNANQRADVEAFIIAFDSDLAPIVGQQVTLTSSNSGVAGPRIDLMIARAAASFPSKVLEDLNGGPVTECDLIAKLRQGSAQRGYLRLSNGAFKPDDGGASISDGALRVLAATPGQEITYTCVPPGSGWRMALDRDGDTLLDGVETGTGVFVNASNTGTRADRIDSDGDGLDDAFEVEIGSDPTDPLSTVPGLSGWGPALLTAALLACGAVLVPPRRQGV
jgi:hypothetical protein